MCRLLPDGFFQIKADGAIDHGATEIGLFEIGSGQVGPFQVGPGQISPGQVSPGEVGHRQVGAEEAMGRSLRRYGQVSPVVVCLRAEIPVLIDGFKRLAAARVSWVVMSTISIRNPEETLDSDIRLIYGKIVSVYVCSLQSLRPSKPSIVHLQIAICEGDITC